MKIKRIKITLMASILSFSAYPAYAIVTYTPVRPNVEQQVTFQVTNPSGIIVPGSVRWRFGDGTSASGPTTVNKTYTAAGTYAVEVTYNTSVGAPNWKTETVVITVEERRRIVATPSDPLVNQTVTFIAQNFLSGSIRWDFGDGTPPLVSSVNETHVFLKPGAYTVRAWDWGGGFGEAAIRAVVIREETGARAPFQVSFIQLRFDDGKSYKVVAQNFRPLRAYADMRYEGTGLFQAQRLLDGKPFGISTKAMPFYDLVTIESGGLPGLPTQELGMHEVSLKILQPQTDFEIPVIRYFVAASEGPELKRADVNILAAEGLEGVECTLEQGILQAPSGSYAILRGNIQSRDIAPVPWALLRIHIGSELVDQQLFKNLRPGEKREFVTSIFNRSPDPKIIYITLYDITKQPPELLFLRKLSLEQR